MTRSDPKKRYGSGERGRQTSSISLCTNYIRGSHVELNPQNLGFQLQPRTVGGHNKIIWLVVWNIFYFSIYWEYSSQLTNIVQKGWNHQPVVDIPSSRINRILRCCPEYGGYNHQNDQKFGRYLHIVVMLAGHGGSTMRLSYFQTNPRSHWQQLK